MAMPKTRRLNRLPKSGTPEALAARLPSELRSFDTWHYRDGLRDYLKALADAVPEHLTHPVMSAAGLSAADWFRQHAFPPPIGHMHDLKIPGCAYRTRRGDTWPRHKSKARNKRSERRRVIATLHEENTFAVRHCQ